MSLAFTKNRDLNFDKRNRQFFLTIGRGKIQNGNKLMFHNEKPRYFGG